MKKSIINGVIIAVFGLLIALGPRFLFRICGIESCCQETIPDCYWVGQALLGIGFLITALGLCFIVFDDEKVQLGLLIGVFLAGIVTIFIPNGLLQVCQDATMSCKTTMLPAITVIGAALLAYSGFTIVYGEFKKKPS